MKGQTTTRLKADQQGFRNTVFLRPDSEVGYREDGVAMILKATALGEDGPHNLLQEPIFWTEAAPP